MSSRDEILGRIRRSQRRGPLGPAQREAVEKRITEHPRGPQLSRVALEPGPLVDLFVAKATAAAATVARVPHADDAPGAVADYLARENLPASLVMAPDPALETINWSARSLLSIRRGLPQPGDPVGVTGAFAGVAETGTLVLLSGATSPTTLNLLPETHIVLLRRGQIVGAFEDAWDRLRRIGGDALPRTVNLITGPSRSADIGQQLQMGAHGPRRLHVVLIDDER